MVGILNIKRRRDMKIELKDVHEDEVIYFLEQLKDVDGLTNHQVDQINDAISQHFQTTLQICRHTDDDVWEIWR
jgi:hypothetical protein